MPNKAAAAAYDAADSAAARLAERALTLLGVPLLLASVGWGASQIIALRDTSRDAAGQLALQQARVVELERRQAADALSLNLRMREEVAAVREAMLEAVRRGEAARAELVRVRDERDREHDRQIAELFGQAASGRELMARVLERLEVVGRDVTELKGLVMQRPPAPPPARGIDRLPGGSWTPPR